jgi:hypothetical protein
VQNVVPVTVERSLAERALADRRDQYEAEVRALLDAAFAVMRRTESIDPPVRDIVREAVLADGRRQLVAYLASRLAATDDPAEQVRRYVDGIMAQSRDAAAAEATRPFAIDGNRLAAHYPEAVAASRAELLDLARPAVHALGGDDLDVELIHDLTMARMHDALVQRRRPQPREVQRLVDFCVKGLHRGT